MIHMGRRIGRKKVYIMKVNEGFLLKKVADSFVIVPTGANIVDFSAMITINETGALLWNKLVDGATEDELVETIISEYEIDEETARQDVVEFVNALSEKKVIEI